MVFAVGFLPLASAVKVHPSVPTLVLHSLLAEYYPFECTTVCLCLSQRMDTGLLLVVGNAKLQEACVSAVPLASHLMQLLGLTVTLTF